MQAGGMRRRPARGGIASVRSSDGSRIVAAVRTRSVPDGGRLTQPPQADTEQSRRERRWRLPRAGSRKGGEERGGIPDRLRDARSACPMVC